MGDSWFIHIHAMGRMTEMGLTRVQVIDAIEDADFTYPGSTKYTDGRMVHVKPPLAVVVNPTERTVITILWHLENGRDT